MIDFTLTEKDRQLLDQVRAEALVCRKYARYYDEHEEEFIPDEFPEYNDFPNVYAHFAGRTENDIAADRCSSCRAPLSSARFRAGVRDKARRHGRRWLGEP